MIKNKRHIIIGSVFFIIHSFYFFFSYKCSHFDYYYYTPFFKFSKKVIIIVFIIMLVLKFTKLLAISKRHIYLYLYYVVIFYLSAFIGGITWMIVFNVQL